MRHLVRFVAAGTAGFSLHNTEAEATALAEQDAVVKEARDKYASVSAVWPAQRRGDGPWLVEIAADDFATALAAAEEERLRLVDAEDQPLREAAAVVVRTPSTCCPLLVVGPAEVAWCR